jgi:hypothetical protein
MNRNRILIPAILLFLACFSLAFALVPDDAIASETWSPIATPMAFGRGVPRRCGHRPGGCK